MIEIHKRIIRKLHRGRRGGEGPEGMGGVLTHLSHIGTCCPKGCGFATDLV